MSTAAGAAQVHERDRLVLELRALAHTARTMIAQLRREMAEAEALAEQAARQEAADVELLEQLMGGVGARRDLAAAEKVGGWGAAGPGRPLRVSMAEGARCCHGRWLLFTGLQAACRWQLRRLALPRRACPQAAEQRLQEAQRQLAREQSSLVALFRELSGLQANATNAEMLGRAAQQHVAALERRLEAVVLAEVRARCTWLRGARTAPCWRWMSGARPPRHCMHVLATRHRVFQSPIYLPLGLPPPPQDMSEAALVQAAIEELQQGGGQAEEGWREFSQLAGAQLAAAQQQQERVRARMAAVLAAVEALHSARQLRKVFLEGKLNAAEAQRRLLGEQAAVGGAAA
jgi:hypothetical protein